MKQSYRTEAEPQLFLRNLPFFYFWVFKVSSVPRYSVSLFVCAFIFVNKKKIKKYSELTQGANIYLLPDTLSK